MTEHTNHPTNPWTRLVGPLPPAQSAAVVAVATTAAAVTWQRAYKHRGPAVAAVLGALAFDLAGGLVSFQLPPTRAAYAKKSHLERLAFVAAHVHPFILPALGAGTWRRAGARYATAVAASVALDRGLSEDHRRAVAIAAGAAAALTDLAGDTRERWFGPLYLVKLISGHAGIPEAGMDRGDRVSRAG